MNSTPNSVSWNKCGKRTNILNTFETNWRFFTIIRESSELHDEDVEENGALRGFWNISGLSIGELKCRFKSASKSRSNIQISQNSDKSEHDILELQQLSSWAAQNLDLQRADVQENFVWTAKFIFLGHEAASVCNGIPTFRGVLVFTDRHVQDTAALTVRITRLPLNARFLLAPTQRHVPESSLTRLRKPQKPDAFGFRYELSLLVGVHTAERNKTLQGTFTCLELFLATVQLDAQILSNIFIYL